MPPGQPSSGFACQPAISKAMIRLGAAERGGVARSARRGAPARSRPSRCRRSTWRPPGPVGGATVPSKRRQRAREGAFGFAGVGRVEVVAEADQARVQFLAMPCAGTAPGDRRDVGHADGGGERLRERPQEGERFPLVEPGAGDVVGALHRLEGAQGASRVAVEHRLGGLCLCFLAAASALREACEGRPRCRRRVAGGARRSPLGAGRRSTARHACKRHGERRWEKMEPGDEGRDHVSSSNNRPPRPRLWWAARPTRSRARDGRRAGGRRAPARRDRVLQRAAGRAAGARARPSTRAAPSARSSALLAPFADEVRLVIEPAAETTTLQTEGLGEARRQRLLAWAGAIAAERLPGARILHLAPVARELAAPPAGDGVSSGSRRRGSCAAGADPAPRSCRGRQALRRSSSSREPTRSC